MRRWPALLMLAATGCGGGGAGTPAPAPVARPMHVMSVNQCTDQLVLALLPPERIASVSFLARDPGGSLMVAQAHAVATNRGRAEEVLAQRPDLVVAGSFGTPALREMLRDLDYPLIEIDQPASLDDIRRVTRQLAAALDERARGEALIADMDRQLAALARDAGPAVPVVAWDRTGFAAAEGSLFGAILTAAGADNRVRQPAGATARPDVETVLQAAPALLVQGSNHAEAPSLGDDALDHPAIRRRWGQRTAFVRSAYYACGTPLIAEAAIRLRAQLRAAQGNAR